MLPCTGGKHPVCRGDYFSSLLAGDGIGKEVLPEGIKVVQAAAARIRIELLIDVFDWANCDYYVTHGRMMPEDWKSLLQPYDAIYFGAVG